MQDSLRLPPTPKLNNFKLSLVSILNAPLTIRQLMRPGNILTHTKNARQPYPVLQLLAVLETCPGLTVYLVTARKLQTTKGIQT